MVPWLLGLGVVQSLAYSVPPLRLKAQAPVALLVAPALTGLMLVESHLAVAGLSAPSWGVVALATLFQGYAELAHTLRAAVIGGPSTKRTGRVTLMHLQGCQVLSALCAAALAALRPLFALSLAASVVRWRALQRATPEGVAAERSQWLSPLWCLPEFAGYAAIGWWRLW